MLTETCSGHRNSAPTNMLCTDRVPRVAAWATAGLLILTTLAWAGGEPWKDKPYSQWTEQDVARVLQASPWVKNVDSAGAWHPADSHAVDNVGAYPGGNTVAGPCGTIAGGASRNPGPAGPQMYTVFWWSSRTVQAASMRRMVLKGTMKDVDAEKLLARGSSEYMILIQAANMAIFQQRGEAAFVTAAYIQSKKDKQKISPSHVTFFRAPNGETVTGAVFYFPKAQNGQPTVSPDEKEVDFHLQIGEQKLDTFFEPRKMVNSQGEDL